MVLFLKSKLMDTYICINELAKYKSDTYVTQSHPAITEKQQRIVCKISELQKVTVLYTDNVEMTITQVVPKG